MNNYKDAKVVLVPTEYISDIYLNMSESEFKYAPNDPLTDTKQYIKKFYYNHDTTTEYQYLYIILNRKESDISTHLSLNDWYLVELYNIEGKSIGLKLEQVKSISDCWINNNSVETTRHQDNCKKIIASTNKYLYITHINMEYEHIYYPKPTDKWIKSFIKSLTEENIITNVKVNYIGIISHEPKGNKYDSMQFEPKLDSDGCIEIAII